MALPLLLLPGALRRGCQPCPCSPLQLARHNKELQSMLKPGGQVDGDAALGFYAKHTAQIEVLWRAPHAHARLGCPGVL